MNELLAILQFYSTDDLKALIRRLQEEIDNREDRYMRKEKETYYEHI